MQTDSPIHMSDFDLDLIADRIHDAAAHRGIPIVPAGVDLDAVHVLVDNEFDLDAFLELAGNLGSPALYLDTHALDTEDIDECCAGLPDGHPTFDALAAHLHETTFLAVAFAGGGLVHSWFSEASWYADLTAAVRFAADERAVTLAADEAERAVVALAEYAVELAADQKFRRAPTPQRPGLARRRAADLPDHLIEELVDRASAIVDADLGPRTRQLRAGGTTKAAIAAQLGVGAAAVDRYLAGTDT